MIRYRQVGVLGDRLRWIAGWVGGVVAAAKRAVIAHRIVWL